MKSIEAPKRLLLVEDLTVDAAFLLATAPISMRFLPQAMGQQPQETHFAFPSVPGLTVVLPPGMIARVPNGYQLNSDDLRAIGQYPVVVAQDLTAAQRLVKEQPFDTVITDLFLVAEADDKWATHGDDYFQFIPFEERAPQILCPRGLQLARYVRDLPNHHFNKRVPLIVFTFFWTHPRFQRYTEEIERLGSIGYLPKYFRARYKPSPTPPPRYPRRAPSRLLKIGDDALSCLLQLLHLADSPGLPPPLASPPEHLVRSLFHMVAQALQTARVRSQVVSSIKAIHDALVPVYRMTLEAELRFRLPFSVHSSNVDQQPWVSQVLRSLCSSSDVSQTKVTLTLFNLGPNGTVLTKAQDYEIIPGVSTPRQRLLLLVLLALALYSFPHPTGVSEYLSAADLSAILGNAGVTELPARFPVHEISEIRRILADALDGDTWLAHNILVSEGKNGYYLNASFKIDLLS